MKSTRQGNPQSITPSLTVGRLIKARKLALRRGVWFRALSRIERGAVDLTMRYIDSIKSPRLARMLTAILTKLKHETESKAEHMVRVFGLPLAKKVSRIAVRWGYYSAIKWAEDINFAQYLALNFAKTTWTE
jgi:hypothetical protein